MKRNLWATLLALLTISVSAMFFTSCSNDNDDNDRYDYKSLGYTGGNKDAYIATTDIKAVSLENIEELKKGNVKIFQDFSYMYDLSLINNTIELIPYIRKNGTWNGYYNSYSYNYKLFNNKDCGKVSSISDITEKVEIEYNTSSPAAQPGHGYAACFLTETGIKHLRLYISEYKLDSNEEAVESITIQYQLY